MKTTGTLIWLYSNIHALKRSRPQGTLRNVYIFQERLAILNKDQ